MVWCGLGFVESIGVALGALGADLLFIFHTVSESAGHSAIFSFMLIRRSPMLSDTAVVEAAA